MGKIKLEKLIKITRNVKNQDSLGSPSCGSIVSDEPVYIHTMRHAYQQPWELQQSRMMTASCHPVQQNCYAGYGMNDIVPIQVNMT